MATRAPSTPSSGSSTAIGRRIPGRARGRGDARRDRLAPAAERELVLAAKRGGPSEREELVEAFLPLIGSVARIYRHRVQVDRTELMQEGVAATALTAPCEPRIAAAGTAAGP